MTENIKEWNEIGMQDADQKGIDFIKMTLIDQEVTGSLVSTFESPNYGTKTYVLETGEEKRKGVNGCTVLDRKMSNVEIGQQVKIVYLGKKLNEKTGRDYHDYAVYTK